MIAAGPAGWAQVSSSFPVWRISSVARAEDLGLVPLGKLAGSFVLRVGRAEKKPGSAGVAQAESHGSVGYSCSVFGEADGPVLCADPQ